MPRCCEHGHDARGTHRAGLRGAPRSGAIARRPRFLDQVRARWPRRRRRARSRSTSAAAPGCHLAVLPRPAVALDAAHAMVRLAREAAPDAWPVQADLEALPFRARRARRRLGACELPPRPRPSGCRLALADLHRRARGRRAGAPRAPRRARPTASSATTTSRALVRGVDGRRPRRRAARRRLRRSSRARSTPTTRSGSRPGSGAPARCPTPSVPACACSSAG